MDIRSEVGLLSRNLVITSDARNDTDSNITGTRFGGHIMMLPGNLSHDNIERRSKCKNRKKQNEAISKLMVCRK